MTFALALYLVIVTALVLSIVVDSVQAIRSWWSRRRDVA